MNKYHAQRTVADGRTFASKKEAARWCELRLLDEYEGYQTDGVGDQLLERRVRKLLPESFTRLYGDLDRDKNM